MDTKAMLLLVISLKVGRTKMIWRMMIIFLIVMVFYLIGFTLLAAHLCSNFDHFVISNKQYTERVALEMEVQPD